jgi:hypothetical protein
MEDINARNVCTESCAPYFVKRLGVTDLRPPRMSG